MATLAEADIQFPDLTRPAVNPWFIALTVMLATFMEVLDTSIANVALPHIAGSLSAGIDESTWVLTSYLVSNAIVLPLTGWFSRLFGRKRFYMACVPEPHNRLLDVCPCVDHFPGSARLPFRSHQCHRFFVRPEGAHEQRHRAHQSRPQH